MTVPTRPLAEVTRQAIAVLTRELGAADTLRFVNQFTTGLGDYTAEREQLFAGETLDEIISAVKAKAPARPEESPPPKRAKGRKRQGR